jgi:hypothetical protein
MPQDTGNSVLLQVRAAMTTTPELNESPLEAFITNRIAPYFDRLNANANPLEVLRDAYLCGLFDANITLAEVAHDA